MCRFLSATSSNVRAAKGSLVVAAAAAAVFAALSSGCTPTDTDGQAGAETGTLSGSVALFSDIRLSGDQTMTIVYSASATATSVSAFYVEVESTSPDAAAVGVEVTFGTDLPNGDKQTINLPTGSIPLGIYRVGLTLANAGETLKVFSQGTFEITALPTPEFTLPNQDLVVIPGTAIEIRITVGDPENAVKWRLFYIDAAADTTGVPVDQLGAEITTGAANVVIESWNTSAVPLGVYRIGISVTDSGQSIAQTVASGQEGRITTVFNDFTIELTDEPPAPQPPSVVVSQPSVDRSILGTETVLIEFAATVREGPAELQSIAVFYDFDGLADTFDERFISQNLPVTATSAVFVGSLIDEGETVFVGVTVDDGKNDAVTRYAKGKITRVAPEDAQLEVTKPNSPLARKPGESVEVAWTLTGLPTTALATVDVFMERVDAAGAPVAGESPIAVLAPSALTVTTATIDTAGLAIGVYRVTVRITFEDGTPDLTATAPALVTISTLPKIVWLGNLTGVSPDLRGTVFGGFEQEDNAGSAFAGGEDYDGDGRDDLIIVARYGKPDAFNPSGVGIGEAYLIRGSGTYAGSEFSLNTVGSESGVLPGMVFTGIPVQNPTTSTETHGIASVFISEDADGDSLGEIWFGIPFANYRVTNVRQNLEREGQFVNGGVVCVSSQNARVRGSGDTRGARILLNQVGMLFQGNEVVGPEPREADGSPNADMIDLCSGESIWLLDLMEWFEGECDTGTTPPPADQWDGCVGPFDGQWTGGDGEQDTLIEPRHGFSPTLANNFVWSTIVRTGFAPCQLTTLTLENDCPSCDGGGSGCNDTCVPFTVVAEPPGDPQATAFLAHTSVEPLDMSDPANQYCNIGGNGPPGSIDLLVEPPPCADQHTANKALMTNPLAILNIDDTFRDILVSMYLFNKDDGIARSPTFTGFYRDEFVDADGEIQLVQPEQPFGMRIIGRPRTTGVFAAGDHEEFSVFGTSITQVGESIIISAPQRDALEDFDAVDFIPPGGELEDAGVLYMADNFAYWEFDTAADGTVVRMPPKPHMFLAGGGGNTGFVAEGDGIPPGTGTARWDLARDREFTLSSRPSKIVGGAGENIETVASVGDFDGDTREDFAVGSPRRGGGDGAVYIVFRRAPSLEGDFILDKLALATNASERLNGVLVVGDPGGGEGFGQVIATGVDFNGDNIGDVIVGNPNGNGGTGEVFIIFSQTGVVSPAGGTSVETLLADGQAARILGTDPGTEFGFSVANAGDVDGDGKDDLLIAAPSGTPRFDPDPFDTTLSLTEFGLDFDLDGNQDDVTGPFGVPDGIVNDDDDLTHAGLVYLILSSADARTWTHASGNFEIDIDELGSLELPGVMFVGRSGERTAASGAFIDGDYLGGGNAADTSQGGSADKAPIAAVGFDRGRGVGLGGAGDVDGDGLDDFLIGAILADPRVNPQTGEGIRNAGEAYLINGFRP